MSGSQTLYIIYIASTAEKIWEALTRPELTRQFFFGRTIEVECKTGAPFVLRMPDGRIDSQGKVVACDRPGLLSTTWHVEWLEQFRNLPEVIVTFAIEPAGASAVRLTLTESHQQPIDEKMLEAGRNGWAMILSGLKTLLETGKPLRIPTPEPPA